jgi:hypothetical protein
MLTQENDMTSTILEPQTLTPIRATSPGVTPAAPQGFIKRHALLMFFCIAFAISFAGILLVIGLGGVQDGVAMTDARFGLMMLAWLAGPSVASVIMTGLVSGRPGYRDLLRRLGTYSQSCELHIRMARLEPSPVSENVTSSGVTGPTFPAHRHTPRSARKQSVPET